jgi:RNA polymerase sigma-70 factor (ECF subfamily)
VDNRIRDEIRRVGRHPIDDLEVGTIELPSHSPSPFDSASDAEQQQKYKQALATLNDDERQLVVGRLELGYNYEQLALVANRPTAEAARVAVRRAVTKIARNMAGV